MYTILKFCAVIFCTATVTSLPGATKESQPESLDRDKKVQNFVLFFIEPDLDERECEHLKIGKMKFPLQKTIAPYKCEKNGEVKLHTHKPHYNICTQMLQHCLMTLLTWAETFKGMSTASVILHITEMKCNNTESPAEPATNKPTNEKRHRKPHPIRLHQHRKRSYQGVADTNFFRRNGIRLLRKRNYQLAEPRIFNQINFIKRIKQSNKSPVSLTEDIKHNNNLSLMRQLSESGHSDIQYPSKRSYKVQHSRTPNYSKGIKHRGVNTSVPIDADDSFYQQMKRNSDTKGQKSEDDVNNSDLKAYYPIKKKKRNYHQNQAAKELVIKDIDMVVPDTSSLYQIKKIIQTHRPEHSSLKNISIANEDNDQTESLQHKLGDSALIPSKAKEYDVMQAGLPQVKFDENSSTDNTPMYEVWPYTRSLVFNNINPYATKDIKHSGLYNSTEHIEDIEEAESIGDSEDAGDNVSEKSFGIALKIPGTGSLMQRKMLKSVNTCAKEGSTQRNTADENYNYKNPEHKEIDKVENKETGSDEKCTDQKEEETTEYKDATETTCENNDTPETTANNKDEENNKEDDSCKGSDDSTTEEGTTCSNEDNSTHKSNDENKEDDTCRKPESEDREGGKDQNKEEESCHTEEQKNASGKENQKAEPESENEPLEKTKFIPANKKQKPNEPKDNNLKSEHKEISENTFGHTADDKAKAEFENMKKNHKGGEEADRKSGNGDDDKSSEQKDVPESQDDKEDNSKHCDGDENAEDNNNQVEKDNQGGGGDTTHEEGGNGQLQKPEIFEILSLMANIKKSFFSSMFGPGYVNDETKFKNPSMYDLVTRMIDQLNVMNSNNKGYIAVIMGGKFSDFKNSSSDLSRIFEYLSRKCDNPGTTIVVSGSCPKEDQKQTIPLLVTGANCTCFDSVQDLHDIAHVVKTILKKCDEDKSSERKETLPPPTRPLPVIPERRQILPFP